MQAGSQKIKLQFPTEWSFSCQIEVAVWHINYGGHVGNDAWLAILHQARLLYLKSLGYQEINADGMVFIITESWLKYTAEGFLGDQLQIQIEPAITGKCRFDLYYQVQRLNSAGSHKTESLLSARTGILCQNLNENQICPIPLKLRAELDR